jgi:hypothetical protein
MEEIHAIHACELASGLCVGLVRDYGRNVCQLEGARSIYLLNGVVPDRLTVELVLDDKGLPVTARDDICPLVAGNRCQTRAPPSPDGLNLHP